MKVDSRFITVLIFSLWLSRGIWACDVTADDQESLNAIDTSRFQSSISHWRNLKDDSRFIQVIDGQPSYKPDQVREIVANILLFQRTNGGWPKDYDMTAVLTSNQRAKVAETRTKEDASYDNGNLHSQVEYLAKAYSQSQDLDWRIACERGIDFIFASQMINGGFPQRYPSANGYHAHITFNDGAMIGILKVLRQAVSGAEHFQWLDPQRRLRANLAVDKGIECVLKCQIRVKGELTGWCQQHDQLTFEPRSARTFELASICPQETTDIVRFMMGVQSPSQELLHSTDAAIAWLEKVRIDGIRVARVDAPAETYLRHTANFDVVVLADQQSKPIWARHYEIDSNSAIFAGRDGIKKFTLAEIERERRTGTQWYGNWPAALLKDYPNWRKSQ